MRRAGPGLAVLFPSRHPWGSWFSVSWATEGWLLKPQPNVALGAREGKVQGHEEQARSVQSTDKMGMDVPLGAQWPWGALPLCIWVQAAPEWSFILMGQGRTWVGGVSDREEPAQPQRCWLITASASALRDSASGGCFPAPGTFLD